MVAETHASTSGGTTGQSARWVAAAPADCGPYQLLSQDGCERRLSLHSIHNVPAPAARQPSARCCALVPLRAGVIVIGAVLLVAEVLLTAAAGALHCLWGDHIRADVHPRLHLLRLYNISSPEEHSRAVAATDAYVAVLERGLLVVAGLSAVGVVSCALLVQAARARHACLLLPWLVWHGCLLLLASAVSAGGLALGALQRVQSWLVCSVVGLTLAALTWYWYAQVVRFYLSIRPARLISGLSRHERQAVSSGSRRDAQRPAPLPMHDKV